MWDAATGELTAQLGAHDGAFAWRNAVAWSPDGKRLALAGDSGFFGIWEWAKGAGARKYAGHSDAVWSLAWRSDGRRLATASQDSTLKIWDVDLEPEGRTLPGGDAWGAQYTWTLGKLAGSPHGNRLAAPGVAAKGRISVFDTASGQEVLAVSGAGNEITSVAWNPDGHRLACGCSDGRIRIVDPSQGAEIDAYEGHTGPVLSLAGSPDGCDLASGSEDAAAKVWNAAAGKELITFRPSETAVSSVAWSPDGKRSATAPGTVARSPSGMCTRVRSSSL